MVVATSSAISRLTIRCAATRWLRDHAAELRVDESLVGVSGDSAGGNLAAVMSIDARDPRLRRRACAAVARPAATGRLIGSERCAGGASPRRAWNRPPPLHHRRRPIRGTGVTSRERSCGAKASGTYCDAVQWPRSANFRPASPFPSRHSGVHTGKVQHSLVPPIRQAPVPPPSSISMSKPN